MSKNSGRTGVGGDLELGKDGPRLVASSQIIEARETGGSLARVKAAPGVAADDVATVAQTTSGGVSFGVLNPLVAPSSPDSRNVETWTDLPTDWAAWTPETGDNPLNVARSVVEGTLVLDGQPVTFNPAAQRRRTSGVYRPIPTENQWAAYTRVTIIAPREVSGVYHGMGFGVGGDFAGNPDGASWAGADIVREDSNSLDNNVGFVQSTTSSSGFDRPSAAADPGVMLRASSYWLRVQKTDAGVGNLYAFDYSLDGLAWLRIHTGSARALTFTPTNLLIYLRIAIDPPNGSADYRVLVGPVRFATGNGAVQLNSLIPAGK